ncbi:HNH endonuclease signature motif containing protein [Streptomyces sp. NPDC052773]|uniref:HNH endonuclease signature motif containing protein n=1 Tax=Streptomyces sp. NPDC052773 TaxID=3365693 RepID=UPI0037CD50F8
MSACSVTTCDKPAVKRGWCSAHYSRWRKKGDVQAHIPLRPFLDPHAQIMSKVDKNGPGGCWLWKGHVLPTGYGTVNAFGTVLLAHRAAYRLLVGPIPDGLTLDHLCRVTHCVNPDHLEPVTRRENIRRRDTHRSQK